MSNNGNNIPKTRQDFADRKLHQIPNEYLSDEEKILKRAVEDIADAIDFNWRNKNGRRGSYGKIFVKALRAVASFSFKKADDLINKEIIRQISEERAKRLLQGKGEEPGELEQQMSALKDVADTLKADDVPKLWYVHLPNNEVQMELPQEAGARIFEKLLQSENAAIKPLAFQIGQRLIDVDAITEEDVNGLLKKYRPEEFACMEQEAEQAAALPTSA